MQTFYTGYLLLIYNKETLWQWASKCTHLVSGWSLHYGLQCWTRFFSKNLYLSFIQVPATSAVEIRQIIASLKCKTTSNSYDIPAKFFKISVSSLSSWLSQFFNKCMAKGEFPYLLKIAQITPIPKITSPKSPNDYSPISILPTLSEVFEKVITADCTLFSPVIVYWAHNNMASIPITLLN